MESMLELGLEQGLSYADTGADEFAAMTEAIDALKAQANVLALQALDARRRERELRDSLLNVGHIIAGVLDMELVAPAVGDEPLPF